MPHDTPKRAPQHSTRPARRDTARHQTRAPARGRDSVGGRGRGRAEAEAEGAGARVGGAGAQGPGPEGGREAVVAGPGRAHTP